MDLIKQLEQRLMLAFPGAEIKITSPDQVHFDALIRATQFKGLSRVAQQQKVYAALGDLIVSGTIHALSLQTQILE